MTTDTAEIHQVPPAQKARFDKYLDEHCDSRCYDEGKCPHEGDFFEILADEMNAQHD